MKNNTVSASRCSRVAILAAKIFLIFIIVIITVTFIINTGASKKYISHILTEKTGREISLTGKIYLKPALHPTIHIEGLTVANMENGRANKMADISEFEVAVAFFPLFNHKAVIKKLALIDSELNIEKNAAGDANWVLKKPDPETDKKSTPMAVVLDNIYLENSSFTYLDEQSKTDIKLLAYTKGKDLVLQGNGEHLGREFKIDADIGSFVNLRTAKPVPIESSLTVGNTTLNFKGTVEDPAKLKGLDLALQVKGADAAELFPLLGIALLPTPPYDITGQLTFDNGKWKFSDFKGKMGSSDLAGSLTWDKTGKRPKLSAVFVSENLSFKDLGPLIGLSPEKKVSAEQKQLAAREDAKPTVIPDVPLDITKISSMDADVELTGKKVISPNLPLDNFYMHLTLEDRILKLTPVKFGTANGDITANITVNAQTLPAHDEADITFYKLSLARMLSGANKAIPSMKKAEGYLGGTMKFKGVGNSLHEVFTTAEGTLGIGMEGGQVSNLLVEIIGLDIAESLRFLIAGDKPVPIRCIVGDFDINKGVMGMNSFVVDTNDTVVTGSGEINLGNEKMHVKLDPQPKHSSIISLRSPIKIDGTLKNPDINVGARAVLTRGGLAAGLGALFPPVAALAFIEPGLGKDSNCAGLIREMDKNNGETKDTNMVPKNKK